jgi:hypothetical protein
MGIDNNPLMLDLTISEHFQNRHRLLSPLSAAPSANHNHRAATTTNNNNKSLVSRKPLHSTSHKKSDRSQNSHSTNNKSEASPSASLVLNPRSHSMIAADSDAISETNPHSTSHMNRGSFSIFEFDNKDNGNSRAG